MRNAETTCCTNEPWDPRCPLSALSKNFFASSSNDLLLGHWLKGLWLMTDLPIRCKIGTLWMEDLLLSLIFFLLGFWWGLRSDHVLINHRSKSLDPIIFYLVHVQVHINYKSRKTWYIIVVIWIWAGFIIIVLRLSLCLKSTASLTSGSSHLHGENLVVTLVLNCCHRTKM